MKLAYITAISLPCKGGTNDPTKHAAFRSHPSRPNKAPKKTTPVARNELTSSPI